MKKLLLLSFIFLSCSFLPAKAQTPFNTKDSIDINNLHIPILMHGDMSWRLDSELSPNVYFYPTIPSRLIDFWASIWMSGNDAANNLHISASTYRADGIDYWPGPLDASDTLTYATSQNWAKIWKVNGTDVQHFNSLATHTIANTPNAILTWPAKGNALARGNSGVALTVTDDMAPFIDLNGNGIYEPLLGDYPDFKGDQVLWWIFSDNGPTHSLTHGKPLGVEVHAMAYAYNRGTLIDNVVYFDYTVVNKSVNTYQNSRIAEWNDISIGWYLDNFIGSDSTWRMGINYDGTNDFSVGGGRPTNSYYLTPPQLAITMIVQPGDVGTNYIPAGSFDYYNNDASDVGNPIGDTEFNNYMHAKLRNGQHFTNDFADPGIQCQAFGSGPDCNYVYTGDPGDTTQWSECVCNNNPANRHSILSSNDFTLNAGGSAHFVFAVIIADSARGCPFATFDSIRVVADTAWNAYYNPPTPLHRADPTGISNIGTYPNPASDILYVEDKLHSLDNATIILYNYTGNVVDVPVAKNGQRFELSVHQLSPGIYNVLYRNGSVQTTSKFLKE